MFGVILQNDYPENGLHYIRKDEFDTEDAHNTEYTLRETPGSCFVMTGACRTKWMHGIEFWTGRRVSVTWRWHKSIDGVLDGQTLDV